MDHCHTIVSIGEMSGDGKSVATVVALTTADDNQLIGFFCEDLLLQ